MLYFQLSDSAVCFKVSAEVSFNFSFIWSAGAISSSNDEKYCNWWKIVNSQIELFYCFSIYHKTFYNF